jgi:methionyl aminopeptidase
MANAVIHTSRQIAQLRQACNLAAETLLLVGQKLQAGMTTDDVNTLVHQHTLTQDAWPAPLNYRGSYPKSVCTSVNEVICHGIPGPQVLRDGDIINVDVTTIFPKKGGWYGDTSATFYVGQPSPMARHVVEVCRVSLELALAAARPGATLGDIGWAIQQYAESKGCSVVRDYTGHGIGRIFHGPPSVKHYGRPGTGLRLKPGMTFTIEPMINLGTPEVAHLDDGWTAVTADRSLSAQFEHTLVITHDGCDVLTRRNAVLVNSEDKPWVEKLPLSCFVADDANARAILAEVGVSV